MNVFVSTSDLSTSLNKVKGAISLDNKALPILQGVLFKCDGNKITLTGYNLEHSISTVIDCGMGSDTVTAVLPKLALDVIAKLNDSTTSLSFEDNSLTIKSGKFKSKTQYMPAGEYPDVPNFSDIENAVEFNTDELLTGVKSVVYATSKKDTKPILTGVLFNACGGSMDMAALDGFRLATYTMKTAGEFKAVIPNIALKHVINIFNAKSPTKFGVTKKHVIFENDGYTITSRKLEGDFHDYKKSMPTSFTGETDVDCLEIVKACERIKTATAMSDRIKAPCVFEVSNEGVTLSAKTTMGECSETLNIKAANPIKIGFNVEYLAECFKNLPSTTAILKYAGGLSPAAITTPTGEAVSLVLPVRLTKESV